MTDGRPQPRSIPVSMTLPFDGPSVLACGSETRNTFCLTRGRSAYVSDDMGDLTESRSYELFVDSIKELSDILDVSPEIIACDMHPDYAPTRYGRRVADTACESVQHHHAHIAACMVEHGLQDKTIGIAFDGMGYGSDGTMWGGEFLLCDLQQFTRAAHFKQYVMPGGDSATMYPERMAFSCLLSEQPDAIESLLPGIDDGTRGVLRRMIESDVRSPRTSSAGRLFDAVSAMLGFTGMIAHPAEAAIKLQELASEGVDDTYGFDFADGVLSFAPMIRSIASDVAAARNRGDIAAMFHNTLAEASAAVCDRIRAEKEVDRVALAGGVFMNSLLRTLLTNRLNDKGFEVYTNSILSCGDSSLSLGQAAVALARWQERTGAAVPGSTEKEALCV